MSTTRADDSTVIVRPWRSADRDAVLELFETALGWRPDDPNAAFFSWKHHENPFGVSPAWVAVDADRIAAFRTFMRWEFADGYRVVTAVRAVDTATHPDYQGRGLFTRLTRQALDELCRDGVDFVFNTPNDQSRPGYLKMGWQVVGRLPAATRPRSIRSLITMASARTPADLWSLPCSLGLPAATAFSDALETEHLIRGAAQPSQQGLRTRLSPAFLRWRYGFQPLQYRVALLTPSLADGAVIFRLRRRGPATELVVADVLAPENAGRSVRKALRRCLREAGADYAIAVTRQSPLRSGLIRLPGQGPLLTWRGLATTEQPAVAQWRLTLGDVELF